MKTVTVDDYQADKIAQACKRELSRLRELHQFWKSHPREQKTVLCQMREIGKIRHLFRIRGRRAFAPLMLAKAKILAAQSKERI